MQCGAVQCRESASRLNTVDMDTLARVIGILGSISGDRVIYLRKDVVLGSFLLIYIKRNNIVQFRVAEIHMNHMMF